MRQLTKDAYLYNAGDAKSPRIIRERPEDVRRTINEVPFAKGAMHVLENLFGFDEMRQFRDQLQLSPNELNNIKSPNVINQLDRIINQKVSMRLPQMPAGFGVRYLLEQTLKFYPNPETLGIESKMAAVFTGLNFLGFWPDNPKRTSPLAAFHDSMHAANAAFCDYFVTEDKALRLKTLSVYEFFGIGTKVVDVDEVNETINK